MGDTLSFAASAAISQQLLGNLSATAAICKQLYVAICKQLLPCLCTCGNVGGQRLPFLINCCGWRDFFAMDWQATAAAICIQVLPCVRNRLPCVSNCCHLFASFAICKQHLPFVV
jgi:hypothetical protein